MSIRLIRKEADENGVLSAVLYEITIPAFGTYTAPIDVFGFRYFQPIMGPNSDEFIAIPIFVSADAVVWQPVESLAITMNAELGPVLSNVAQASPIYAPYFRFGGDSDHLNKKFYLYCLK